MTFTELLTKIFASVPQTFSQICLLAFVLTIVSFFETQQPLIEEFFIDKFNIRIDMDKLICGFAVCFVLIGLFILNLYFVFGGDDPGAAGNTIITIPQEQVNNNINEIANIEEEQVNNTVHETSDTEAEEQNVNDDDIPLTEEQQNHINMVYDPTAYITEEERARHLE